MTIGKSSKKQKAPWSSPFVDQDQGFYGRLHETETKSGTEVQITQERGGNNSRDLPDDHDHEHCGFDFSEGMMEDDGTTLLKRKPSRLSRRWSRKSSRRTKSEKSSLETGVQSTETEVAPSVDSSLVVEQPGTGSGSKAPEPMLIHFSVREEADDQELIPEGKERQKGMKGKMKEGDKEGKADVESMKVIKRSSIRNCRKVLDKALRRGWETFITNLYSVTLSPVPSSGSSPSKSEMDRKAALADFRL